MTERTLRLELARLVTDPPSGLWPLDKLIAKTAELYDVLWQLHYWGPDTLVDDLAAAGLGPFVSLVPKRDLVRFAVAAWNRAVDALAVLR
jgi:hypothetical protein